MEIRKRLEELGFPQPVLIQGSWSSLHSAEAISEQKWQNFMAYRQIYPYSRFIFLGDSGQLDVECAAKIEREGLLLLGLIHHVQPSFRPDLLQSFPQLHFFHSYVGATYHCLRAELITPYEAYKICEATYREVHHANLQQFSSWYPLFQKETEILIQELQSKGYE